MTDTTTKSRESSKPSESKNQDSTNLNTIAKRPSQSEKVAQLLDGRLLTLAVSGVSKQCPGGRNVRLEPLFEKIENEIAKLDSLTNESPLQWSLVANWCEQILNEQSKDILVACYLGRALCHSNLIVGLVAGLVVHIRLVERFWQDCYPPLKRYRGRAAAYNWWVDQCAALLESHQFTIGDLENLRLVANLLKELDELLQDRFEKDAPTFNEMAQQLQRRISSLETEKKARQRQNNRNKAKSQTPPAGGPIRAPDHSLSPVNPSGLQSVIQSDRELKNYYRTIQEQLRTVSDYLLRRNIADPEAYRINRFLSWLGISQLPPATNLVTQLRPPPKEKLQHYESLLAANQLGQLIPEVENSLAKSPYWLDGQRLVHQALSQLNYSDAAQTVSRSLANFLNRVPKVEELKFADQTPFADAETRRWLQQEAVAEKADCSVNAGLPLKLADENEREQAFARAIELFRDKQPQQALEIFSAGCRQSFSQRELTFWRYYQARFCHQTQQHQLAKALLESMLLNLESRQFDQWEPAITAKVIELLIRTYQMLPEQEIPKGRVTELRERLCQFDLVTAYELSISQSQQ